MINVKHGDDGYAVAYDSKVLEHTYLNGRRFIIRGHQLHPSTSQDTLTIYCTHHDRYYLMYEMMSSTSTDLKMKLLKYESYIGSTFADTMKSQVTKVLFSVDLKSYAFGSRFLIQEAPSSDTCITLNPKENTYGSLSDLAIPVVDTTIAYSALISPDTQILSYFHPANSYW